MTNCKKFPIQFPPLKSKKVLANFQGGSISSDGGVLLLNLIDRKLRLSQAISASFSDSREKGKVQHSVHAMLKQRIFALALGYEDLNDHAFLKDDVALQTALEKESALASPSTLCRFEKAFTRQKAITVHHQLIKTFADSFKTPPKQLVLDADPTDLPVHGNQEGKAYNGYYRHDCFLPLHIFCGSKLLVSYLRPSDQDATKHTWAIFALLVKYFRKRWPKVNIVFRGDGAFCREAMLNWCDRNRVDYVVGIACNARLQKALTPYLKEVTGKQIKSHHTEKVYAQFAYRAHSWKYPRKVIGKAEKTSCGTSMRTIVTSLEGTPEELYRKGYCPRGNMENRIKEQLLLFSYRVSCHEWWPNQFRLLLSSMAYVLLEHLRSGYLKKTQLGLHQVDTLRNKLLKIGAVILKNTRKIKLYFTSSYPYQELFMDLVANLNTS